MFVHKLDSTYMACLRSIAGFQEALSCSRWWSTSSYQSEKINVDSFHFMPQPCTWWQIDSIAMRLAKFSSLMFLIMKLTTMICC